MQGLRPAAPTGRLHGHIRPTLARMPPVDNVAHVMQVLRRQMAENLERMHGSARRPPAAGAPAAAAPAAPSLRQAVARRLRSIDPQDPRYLDKATSVFVESVLLAEFGEALVNDAQFRDMAQRVQSAMLEDSALRDDLARLAVQMARP
jgi:hypothetical protein